jgi:hypothetical protein
MIRIQDRTIAQDTYIVTHNWVIARKEEMTEPPAHSPSCSQSRSYNDTMYMCIKDSRPTSK